MSNFESFIWSEKYRPSNIDDIIIPDNIKQQLKGFLNKGEVPNLLFYGECPGTGKTTTAKSLAFMLGIKPLFINASLHTSIDDIRDLVVQYSTTSSLLSEYGIKIVILDEVDRLSQPAQDACKGIIEFVTNNCRFILTTNNRTKIIDPLRSRCNEIEFAYSNNDLKILSAQMFIRLTSILELEGINYNKQVLASVVKKFSPDNRKILNILQQYSSSHNEINEGLLPLINSGDISILIDYMRQKDYVKVKEFVFNEYDKLGSDFYRKLFTILEPIIEPKCIPDMIIILGEEQKYHDCADRFIHILQTVVKLMMNLTFKKA